MASTRLAKSPLKLPAGVSASFDNGVVIMKGPKGTAELALNSKVGFNLSENTIQLDPIMGKTDDEASVVAITGTMRAILGNMVHGVLQGFEKKLLLVGVGYRAQVQGNVLNLTLGYSHPVRFLIPAGVTIEAPSLTEIIIRGIDKQLVGEVAAKIRRFRQPEPYKGKGIRYSDEVIILKETKKK